jgi:hypothetical protein
MLCNWIAQEQQYQIEHVTRSVDDAKPTRANDPQSVESTPPVSANSHKSRIAESKKTPVTDQDRRFAWRP